MSAPHPELERAREFLRKAWDAWSVDAAADLIWWDLQGCSRQVRTEVERLIATRRAEVTK